MGEQIHQKTNGNIHEQAALAQAAQINTVYDADEFSVPDGQTDFNVATNHTDLFDEVAHAHSLTIRVNGTISIKLNATTNKAITLVASGSPYRFDSLEITNIFITNASGGAVAVKIFMT